LALVELWALCGLAIAQPLLDVTGRAPDFFLFHGARPTDIALLVAAITVAPPVALWALGTTGWLGGHRARRAAHVLTIAALTAALAVQAGKWLSPVRGIPLAVLAAVTGAAAAAAYLRWAAVARLLHLAAVGPLIFVLLFVFASPSSALVLGGRATTSGAGRPVGAHPPLVVIFFDELPQLSLLDDAGAIDARRFPNFAALARHSTWYRNATTVRGFTPYAVPSMLTGRFPTRQAPPHYSQYPDNLFTLLAGTYDLKVQESVVNLCPPERCGGPRPAKVPLHTLLGQSAVLLEKLLSPRDSDEDPEAGFSEPTAGGAAAQRAPDPVSARGRRATTPRVPRPNDRVATFRWARMRDNQPLRFRDFMADLRPSARPTLHFVHLLLPHRPLRYLPSGMRYPVPAGLPETGQWWAQLTRQRHLLQARYADHLLGLALRAMRASGLYDDAAIVVTADHGIAFTRQRSHKRNIVPSQQGAAEIGWVPLFVKAPGQSVARADHRNWLQIDLLPTLADYAGVTVPWRVDGVSALRPPRRSAAKPFVWDHGRHLVLDPRHATAVLAGPDDAIGLPEPPRQDLVGRLTADLTVAGAGGTATVANLRAFGAVVPAGGSVPALVHGTVPAVVPAGTPLAIAVNGVVGAVVPVLPVNGTEPRFAGVIADDALFRPGANRLELFLVTADGAAVRRLRL
jgi:hypothetical protein